MVITASEISRSFSENVLIYCLQQILYFSSLKQLNKLKEVIQLKQILIDNEAYLGFSKLLTHRSIINDFNLILKP